MKEFYNQWIYHFLTLNDSEFLGEENGIQFFRNKDGKITLNHACEELEKKMNKIIHSPFTAQEFKEKDGEIITLSVVVKIAEKNMSIFVNTLKNSKDWYINYLLLERNGDIGDSLLDLNLSKEEKNLVAAITKELIHFVEENNRWRLYFISGEHTIRESEYYKEFLKK